MYASKYHYYHPDTTTNNYDYTNHPTNYSHSRLDSIYQCIRFNVSQGTNFLCYHPFRLTWVCRTTRATTVRKVQTSVAFETSTVNSVAISTSTKFQTIVSVNLSVLTK